MIPAEEHLQKITLPTHKQNTIATEYENGTELLLAYTIVAGG